MSTGFDVTAESVIAQLSETVERGASLLASEERLAGPATPQDSVAELVPGDGSTCVGVGIAFADGSVAAVSLVPEFAAQLCGGVGQDQVTAGLAVVTEQLASGAGAAVVETVWIADPSALQQFLTGRAIVVGAGIFDGDLVVGTVGAAAALDGGGSGAAASAGSRPSVSGGSSPAPGAAAGSVSDAVLARGLALLADVNLDLTVELGRARLRVSDLLALEPGSVIDLEREAGSPVELLVNGTLFARAEVIVVDGNYAVRITELVAKEPAA